jgi:hypothetical protein
MLEHFHAVGEAARAGRYQQPVRATPGVCRQPGRRLSGGELRVVTAVVSVELSRPPCRAAERRRRCRRRALRRRIVCHPWALALYLAEALAKRPVADHQECACRRAGAHWKEVQLQQHLESCSTMIS